MSIDIKSEDKFNLADLDIKDGYLERGYQALQDILKENPNFGKAHNHLGWLHETKFQDYEKAEEHYKKALELSPNNPVVYYNYAVLLSTLQRWDDLNNLLEKALKIKGINKSLIYNEYGLMFEALGEYEKAISYFKKAVIETMDNNVMYKFMGSIERCKQKKF